MAGSSAVSAEGGSGIAKQSQGRRMRVSRTSWAMSPLPWRMGTIRIRGDKVKTPSWTFSGIATVGARLPAAGAYKIKNEKYKKGNHKRFASPLQNFAIYIFNFSFMTAAWLASWVERVVILKEKIA